MHKNAPCCNSAVKLTVTEIFTFFKTIIPTLDKHTAMRIIKGLILIDPSFIHLLNYQLQEPPNPL